MTNPLRLLLLLLMTGSLVAARWADGLGQRLTAVADRLPQVRPQPMVRPSISWAPYGSWQGLARPISQPAQPVQASAVHSL